MVKINTIKYNKKGWIRLVEVFIAILLLTGVLLIITNRSSSDKNNLQVEISKKEIAILRDIELNNSFRAEILNINPENLPIRWDSFNDNELQDVKNRITYLAPKNFECEAKICLINEICIIDNLLGKEVYAEAVIISADLDTYSPKQLKLFCMKK